MKNILLVTALLFSASFAHAQFSIGLKAGIGSATGNYDNITVGSESGDFNLGVKDVKFGTIAGAYMRVGRKFYIQPEFLFNSNRTDFVIGGTGNNEIIKTERYQDLTIPVLLGRKMGPFRFHAGPVAHYHISSKSELSDIEGYESKWKQLTWGWLGGMTIGSGRISADLRYEGNFSKFGDHISFSGQEYNFSNRPARFVFALNYALVK
jgi:Outer membrane protein beta-barrel domain